MNNFNDKECVMSKEEEEGYLQSEMCFAAEFSSQLIIKGDRSSNFHTSTGIFLKPPRPRTALGQPSVGSSLDRQVRSKERERESCKWSLATEIHLHPMTSIQGRKKNREPITKQSWRHVIVSRAMGVWKHDVPGQRYVGVGGRGEGRGEMYNGPAAREHNPVCGDVG